jgi:hypothetical protein
VPSRQVVEGILYSVGAYLSKIAQTASNQPLALLGRFSHRSNALDRCEPGDTAVPPLIRCDETTPIYLPPARTQLSRLGA